jgi:hypothetical protein
MTLAVLFIIWMYQVRLLIAPFFGPHGMPAGSVPGGSLHQAGVPRLPRRGAYGSRTHDMASLPEAHGLSPNLLGMKPG